MSFTGKTVYTVNAKTNTVDSWICFGEITGLYQGKTERLCLLQKVRKTLVLPKRCVFATEEAALVVARSGAN